MKHVDHDQHRLFHEQNSTPDPLASWPEPASSNQFSADCMEYSETFRAPLFTAITTKPSLQLMLAAFGLRGSQQYGVMAVPARSLKLQDIAVGVDMFRDLCQSEAMKKQASDQSFHDRRYQERKRAEAARKAPKKKVVKPGSEPRVPSTE